MQCRLAPAFAVLLAPLALASMLSCAPSERVTVNERMLLRDGEALTPEGGGCMWLSLPAPALVDPSALPKGDLFVREGPEDDVFVVRIFSDQELLATRRYDAPTLQSARLDEFHVTTHAGAAYVFRYWGGTCADLDASAP